MKNLTLEELDDYFKYIRKNFITKRYNYVYTDLESLLYQIKELL